MRTTLVTRIAAVPLIALLSACATQKAAAPATAAAAVPTVSAPAAAAPTALPAPSSGLAPLQWIAVDLAATTTVVAGARDATRVCELAAGSVQVGRFEVGRFLVQPRTAKGCETPQATGASMWVAADRVVIADAAYAPALSRVMPQPGLKISMAYTGNRIFCDDAGKCRITEPLYANARCYAAPPVAEALAKAAKTLAARDATLTLNVLDCYRPIYVQERMFSLVADPKWVAQPKAPRYGGHNRAVAIDLTIEKNGIALDMGTAFDAFDEKSEWNDDGRGISAAQQANRKMLRTLMIEHGFRPYDGEWWHFSLPIDTAALNLPL